MNHLAEREKCRTKRDQGIGLNGSAAAPAALGGRRAGA